MESIDCGFWGFWMGIGWGIAVTLMYFIHELGLGNRRD